MQKPNRFHVLLVILLAGLFFVSSASLADLQAVDDTVKVRLSENSMIITHFEIQRNDDISGNPQVLLESPAQHGSVTLVGSSFLYEPGDSFWDVGADSFVYTLSAADAESSALVILYPDYPSVIHEERFEVASEDTYGRVMTPEGLVLETTFGGVSDELELTLNNHQGSIEEAYAFFVVSPELVTPGEPGGGGSAAGSSITDWGMRNLDSLYMGSDASFVLLTSCDDGSGWPGYRVRGWKTETGKVKLVGEVLSNVAGNFDYVATEELEVQSEHTKVELSHWWREDNQAAVRLRVDGQMAVSPSTLQYFVPCTETRMGLMATSAAPTADRVSIQAAEIRIAYDAPGVEARLVPSFVVDDFESGDLSDWTTTSAQGVSVDDSTPLSGNRSLVVDAVSFDPRLLVNSAPDISELERNVRFMINADNLAIPLTKSVGIFGAGYGANPAGFTEINLILKRVVAGNFLRTIYRDAGSSHTANIGLLDSGDHVIEIQYRSASGPGSDDGYHRVWVDGQLMFEALGLENDDSRLDWIRLGVPATAVPLSGAVLYDNYLSW